MKGTINFVLQILYRKNLRQNLRHNLRQNPRQNLGENPQKNLRRRGWQLCKAGGFLALLVAAGCTTIISETTDKPIESDPGSRTLGAVIDDQSIETTVGVNIRKADPNLDLAHITVTSYNGVVLLTGQVINADLRALAAKTASLVKNVRVVRNELEVGANSSFAARSSDTLLTTKIKSKLLTAKNIKDSRVKVVTENGAVYLLGLVTHAEADIASTVAQETDGVQKVVRLFEYVD